jgi:hypothetical protein
MALETRPGNCNILSLAAMGDHELERLLLKELTRHPLLGAKGYSAQLDTIGSIVVQRGEHVRGIWRSVLGVLEWTPAGYNRPLFQVANVEAAVWHTLVALGLEEPRS